MVQSRLGLDALRVFTDDIVPVLHVHWVGRAEHDAGVAAALTSGCKRVSLVDCVSFAVMRELGLRQALTLDGHFAEQGFGVRPSLP